MPSIQDLNQKFPIVNPDGTPTDYFMRLLMDRGETAGNTLDSVKKVAAELPSKADKVTNLIAGTGLGGGGDLSADRTFDLNASIDLLSDVDTTTTPPTNGQALLYDGPSTTWKPGTVSGGGGGGLVFLATRTAAASASLDFTSLITATYDAYTFELTEIILSLNGASLYVQVSTDNGATWITVGTYITEMFQTNQGTFSGNASYVGSSGFQLSQGIGNGLAGVSLNGSFKLFGSLNAALFTNITFQTWAYKTDGNWYNNIGSGQHQSAVAVNAVRVIPSGGTITSGKVHMYGLANS